MNLTGTQRRRNIVKDITYSDILENIQYITRKIGHTPQKKEYNADPERRCHSDTIKKYFAPWDKVIEDAGFNAFRKSRKDKEKYIDDLLLDLYNVAIQNPEIYEITPLLRLTKYTYATYRQMIGRGADIKKALYARYGIKILKRIPLKERQDIYIREIQNYIKAYNTIPTMREFEVYTGLCLRSVNINFSELVYKATGTINHIFGLRRKNKEKLIKKVIILRMQKRYNEYPDKEKLTRRKFIYKICGIAEKTLKTYFGSTEKALRAAKIPIYPKGFNRRIYNDQQIIQSLQKAAKYYNHTPSMTEYDNFPQRIMKSCSILCRFGKWNNAIIAAELKPGYIFNHLTDKEILKNLVDASLYYNCAVTYSQYEKFPQKICNNKTIISHFGSWNKALIAARLKEEKKKKEFVNHVISN